VRRVVVGVCGAGVAGMIVASILNANGAALTFGLLTAAAVACLMVTTAVAGPALARSLPPDDERAERVERIVRQLVAAGAEEPLVRALVREAVRLGRGQSVEAGAGVHGGRTPSPDEGGI
jgi:TRAP-type mannitol/chloroaromatic compound transport system permease large subunit